MSCEVSYEDLAAYAAGDLAADRAEQVRPHVEQCARCRRRLSALADVDAALGVLRPPEPPARAVLDARRALADLARDAGPPEIMTLEEAAEFLRVPAKQLGELMDELPAFELAGQVRVRRARLIEWIQQRERDYTRRAAAAWAAHAVAGPRGKGVA